MDKQPITKSYLASQAFLFLTQLGDVVTTEIALSQGIREKTPLWVPIIDNFGPIPFGIIRILTGISIMAGMDFLRRKNINPQYILLGTNLVMAEAVIANVLGLMGILPTK